jgi:hypothetical protein
VKKVPKTKPIFIISTHTRNFKKSSSPGWYYWLEDARMAVEGNASGLDECLYDFACIEEVHEGIGIPANEIWFEWIDNTFVEVDKPKEIGKNVVSFWNG